MYGLELWESARRLKRSARKVRTDEVALKLAEEAATEYVIGATQAYAFMAIVAGFFIHFTLKIWFARAPSRWRWWSAATLLSLTLSLIHI